MRLSTVGDDDALVAFCRSEWPRLVGSLSLYVGDRTRAEDLAQETLYRVCRHWRTVRLAASPSAWAHRVAFNLAKSEGRRRAAWSRAQARLGPADASMHAPDPTEALAVRVAVAALPDAQRAAIVLRYFTQLSVSETAAAMGCPENTVKTYTRRALIALRAGGLVDEATIDDEPSLEEIR